MKKYFVIISFLSLLLTLYGQSISDFSIINMNNNRIYNFYDNPAVFFSCIDEDADFLKIEKGNSKEFQVKDLYKGRIWHMEIPLSESYRMYYEQFVQNPEKYFYFSYLEVFKGFKTIRGVCIGDKIENVIKAYPDAVFYKKTSKNSTWQSGDSLWGNEIKVDINNLPKNLGYIVLRQSFFQYNRTTETNWPMHYYLIFVLDKEKRVSSIILTKIVDAV
ncbi:hypothetical protein V1L52_06770 [Treponema sp. HNW]|uniref:hypothetical protein n=1 Tax=Treponema sp. HNW TaxID=3116654 RepID=UPI003D0B3EC6